MTAIAKPKFKTRAPFESSCLQGYINTNYETLVACFGQPQEGDGYKVQAEWSIKFSNGVYATIYDWKQGDDYNGPGCGIPAEAVTDWHIGGMSKKAVQCVEEALNEFLNDNCYREPLQLT